MHADDASPASTELNLQEEFNFRQFDDESWQRLKESIRVKLKDYYPVKLRKKKKIDPDYGHPADVWAGQMLEIAYGSLSMFVGSASKSSKKELQKHHSELHKALVNVVTLLRSMPDDLQRLLPVHADVDDMVGRLNDFDAMVQSIEPNLEMFPRVKIMHSSFKRAAAVDMATRVLSSFKERGGKISITADVDQKYFSDAIKIIQILGEAVGMVYSVLSWKAILQEVVAHSPHLKQE
jgi:hypothetical protein